MKVRPEDWEVLGLEPNTEIPRVRQAYHHRKALYEPTALATYRLPPPESEVPSGPAPDSAAEPGAYLRHHRLSQGLSLHQIAGGTKIGVAILEQIENEDFDALPATVFVRGHTQQFARELKLPNAHEFAKLYIEKMQGDKQEK